MIVYIDYKVIGGILMDNIIREGCLNILAYAFSNRLQAYFQGLLRLSFFKIEGLVKEIGLPCKYGKNGDYSKAYNPADRTI